MSVFLISLPIFLIIFSGWLLSAVVAVIDKFLVNKKIPNPITYSF